MEPRDLARADGVVVVADSQHRDRWGIDGYHPHLVRDGDGASAWLSDNWEVTHTVALVFPQVVRVSRLQVFWGKPSAMPSRFQVRALVGTEWVDVAEVAPEERQGETGVPLPPLELAAVRVSQPPDAAAPSGDRRMRVAELRVIGTLADPPTAVDVEGVREALVSELRQLRLREDEARAAPQLATAMRTRKRAGFTAVVNRDDVRRGRENVATRPWAKRLADGILKDADWWVQQSDEYVHGLIPAGNPRAICPSFEKGCPIHGGARSSFSATLEKPWRWRCKKGGEVWHDGATVTNPATGDEVVVRDDGSGWLAPEGFPNVGRRYFFVAAYRYFLLGKLFSSPYEPDGGSAYRGGTPVVQLALAYAITGEKRYAHTCAVMLNRLAELYRFYDGCVEGPTQRQDGYIGQTFERFLAQNLILACDLVWDEIEGDAALHSFFAAKGDADYDGDGRVTGADFSYNLQHNLLGFIYEYLHRCMPYFDGDFLMYEMTALAALAHCLGNAEIAEETLHSDTGLRVLLTNSWFRDGKYIYDSCGYNVGNAQTPLLIAEWLHGLRAPPRFAEPLDLYNAPEVRMSMLYDFLRRIDCDGRVPQIGDSGGARAPALSVTPRYNSYDEKGLVRLPGQRDYYLSRLQAASGGDLEHFRQGRADWWLLFHAEPPEPVTDATESREAVPGSHLFDDSGIAVLRAGAHAKTRQHVCLTFSKGAYGHGHGDKLAVNILRYGWDMTADLGYPTTWTDIKYGGWETHTASHCTVMLDGRRQTGNVIGRLYFYAAEAPCDVVEASCERAYPGASLYRRTVALVRDDEGEPLYTLDVFRVAGGGTRDYLFHSLGKPEDMSVTVAGSEPAWTRQERGSLAGEDVEPMSKGGYGFLFDVQRAAGGGTVVAAWRPTCGTSQPDRYLLTRESFGACTVTFTITRTGRAGGPRERAVFAFTTDPGNPANRRVVMLPVDSLPVGGAVPVKVEIRGAEAKMWLDGKPVGHVDVAGSPADSGAVGFLHYYNYNFEYRDLVITPADGEAVEADFSRPLDASSWARIDPTYVAEGGVLKAGDSEALGLYLHMPGASGREIIRAKAEGYGVRGQSPFEGHLIVRDVAAESTDVSTFLAVIEATRRAPRVVRVETLPVTPPDADTVACLVETVDADGRTRRDVLMSSMEADVPRRVEVDGNVIHCHGRFGFVRLNGGDVGGLMLVGGGHLVCGAERLDQPGPFRGRVVQADPAGPAVTVLPDGGPQHAPGGLVGRRVLINHPDYICPAVYTVANAEPADAGAVRLTLNLPLLLGLGEVGPVDPAAGSFASKTPVMKLRVNRGLFDGKCVRVSPTAPAHRLRTATEGAFRLADAGAVTAFREGGRYEVYDVGVGDRVEILPAGSRTF